MEFIKALGTPGILIVPDIPPVLSPIQENEPAHAPKQYCFLGRPKFPGLKVATAGATTLAQFTAKAALFRNTFNSLTNFSTRAWSNRRSANPLSARGKREIPRPLLVIATLLFIIAGAVGMVFAFSPSRMQPGNNASTGTGITSGTAKTVVPQPQRTSSVTAGPTPKARGGITLPAQPTPPLQPRPTPPLPVTPTTTVVSTTGLSVAPTSLNTTSCVHGNGSYTCNVVLSLGSRAGSSQSWYTYSIGTAANFSPSNGTIAPGQSMNVKITVFASCTKTGTFVFVSTKTNVTVAWSC
ncbi:MAG: hypothetical protein JO031_00610 [Ktedonobacteraceae bacterium]|nr:hypothetical protein [Ktedonobacteraceae bacterium]